MTTTQATQVKYAYENYRFKALLSVLTDEQRNQYNDYMLQHIDDYKATISKFLSPHELKYMIDELNKVEKFA